jgi:hypothetical protein
LLPLVFQLSSNSRSARMSFSQVQRVFIVEHCLASRSYFTSQSLFRFTFPDSPVPNRPTASRLLNRFPDTWSCRSETDLVDLRRCVQWRHRPRWTFPALNNVFFWFHCNVFFWQIQPVPGMGCGTFRSLSGTVSEGESNCYSEEGVNIRDNVKTRRWEMCLSVEVIGKEVGKWPRSIIHTCTYAQDGSGNNNLQMKIV